ncbi:GGDEF domain-containing protein [Flavobacterium bomense]|uniref:diguanylate cyclase n=1 Tax=Flavobacterium bomense TaxID=2497483 RepID=A0A3S0MCB8_9FLAO|nr:GGDEF domain-containing protein [Flavobacterium bomense]RTZ03578.1 GGDEF domain-containing protein [Flavobacterium bomense]
MKTYYILESIEKFKNDALPKVIYDILKWALIVAIFYLSTYFLPKDFSIIKFLSTEYLIKLYCSIFYTLVVFAITFLFFKKIYAKKYNALQKDNFTDELTGLKNHKALSECLTKMIGELKSDSKIKTISVIILDVDNFKHFNTIFGHTKSDQILKNLGQLLNNDKRVTDETFRQFLRGDEFVVIAKDTNLGEAVKAADRKRKMIENNIFNVNEVFYKLTVSCGVTEFKKDEDTFDTFLNRASQALMTAKNTKGKNNTKSHY